MSLYIGNISARTRRDELERVFIRFGRCNVQLKKDGYGFVVYDFPPNAEKALRALQGRNICGELLNLTWSNKQPRPFPRLETGRNSERVGYARRKVGSNSWRDRRMGIRQQERGDGRGKSSDMHNDERAYGQDDIRDRGVQERQDYREELPDEGDQAAPNLVDSGRWGEQVHDPLVDYEVEHATEVDRYEPYQGYDRKDEDENHHVGYSGSSAPRSFQDNVSGAQIGDANLNKHYNSKTRQTCYRCGDPGHKMRNCPKERTPRKMSNSLDSTLDDDVGKRHRDEEEQERLGSSSRGKMQSNRDNLSMRQQRNDRNVSGSRHHQIQKDVDWPQRKNYGGNKRSRKERETPREDSIKTARRSVISSIRSDYIGSHSTSQSSKSMDRSSFHSRSRSLYSKACSLSGDLRSSSKSRYSRSRSPNSKKSSSPTSLSVSLSQPLPSSPNEVQLNLKGSLEKATCLEYMDHLIEHGQQIEGIVTLENDKPKDTNLAVNNGNVGLYIKVVDDIEKEQHLYEDNNEKHNLLRPSFEATNSSKLVPDRGTGTVTAESLSPETVRETEDILGSGAPKVEYMRALNKKPSSETHVNLRSGHSTSIYSEEMSMVLKHYGLEVPGEDENNLTIGAYFGSARLWPWEIIYYRRLKKGPISTDNYARRVAQNQEHGIVDNYIRSSSGWGELGAEKHY